MKHTYRSPTEAQHVRALACQHAATVVASRPDEPDPAQLAWTLATFFEAYIATGHAGTRAEFGPKAPVALRVVGGQAHG